MLSVYEPQKSYFDRLEKHVNKYSKIYDSNYRKIRNKIFAHKEFSKPSQTQKLFKKTNTEEIQKILIFLMKFYRALWELYYNGRKPILNSNSKCSSYFGRFEKHEPTAARLSCQLRRVALGI